MRLINVVQKKWFRSSILLLMPLIANNLQAQFPARLVLEQANQIAQRNYPLIRQKELLSRTASLNIENLRKGFLPQFSFGGQATYQSDVTSVNLPLPGFNLEPPSKDQYKVFADLNQVIFDGGVVKAQVEIQQLNSAVEEQKVEVELFKLRDRINQLFLGILFLDAQLIQSGLVINDLQTGINKVEVQVQNGVAFRSNLNLMKAEYLKSSQRVIELKASRKGILETLGLFLNQPLDSSIVFEIPVIQEDGLVNRIIRPEIKLFSDQSKLLSQQKILIRSKNLPKANLFLQGGYGRPALNLLKNQFDLFYIGGFRLNWQLGGLYTRKKENQLVEISKRNIDIQKELFLLNTSIQLKQQQAEIEKFRELIAGDIEMINLRKEVTNSAKAQLENSVITANDYLQQVNAEDAARQALIVHRLQLLQAQINYQNISGKQ
jgi:outer membrane protein TolC